MKLNDYIVSASITMDIPFFDVDMLNVSWHGHYVKYFEMARCALLDKIGYNYQEMEQSGHMWPVVDLHVKYKKPTVFQQKVIIEAFLVEYENRMKIQYCIKDHDTNTVLTLGHTIQVAIDKATKTLCYSTPLTFRDKIGVYL